jgi:hypothetical protein
MQIHGRAKLGPAGRLALCEAIRERPDVQSGSERRGCLAGDGASLVAAISRRFAGRATLIGVDG